MEDSTEIGHSAQCDTFGLVHISLATLKSTQLRSFLLSITNWLPTYAAWVVADAGIAEGKNLHAIYRFGLSLSNLESLEYIDEIIGLAQCAKKLGLPFTASVHAAAIEQATENFAKLLDARVISSLIIVTTFDASSEMNWDAMRNGVSLAKNSGVAVTFVGEYSQIQANVLEERWLDEKNFSIYPRTTSQRYGARRNCHGRVGCYVAPDGIIYPCQSLFGITNAQMGSIDRDQPFATKNLSPLRQSMVQWELNGPSVGQHFTVKQRRAGDMCAAHRVDVEAVGIRD